MVGIMPMLELMLLSPVKKNSVMLGMLVQGISYLSEVGARGLLDLGKYH